MQHQPYLVKKLSIELPKMSGAFVTPEIAKDYLVKAISLLQAKKVALEVGLVDRPQGSLVVTIDGSLIICHLKIDQINDFSIVDGYGWMDDETCANALVGGVQVEVRDRSLGFGPNDRFASIKRRRIRILQNGLGEIAIVHYLKLEQSESMLINPSVIKKHPRSPQSMIHAFQAQNQYRNQLMAQAQGKKMTPTAQKKKTTQKTMRDKLVEEEKFEGDELDFNVESAAASERFRRNQDYMEEIFSMFSADSIIQPSVVDLTKTDELSQKKAVIEHEIAQIKQQNAKNHLEKHLEILKNGLETIANTNSAAELDSNAQNLAKSLGLFLQRPTPLISKVPIASPQ